MGVAIAKDGSGIHFDVVGAGKPLVLLAGQANSRRWWDPVRADFAAHYRTIGIDALGTGHSDAPTTAEYSTPRFAEDVIAVLDEIGIDRAHVYGSARHRRPVLPGRQRHLLVEAIPGAELALLPARHAYFIEQRDEATRRVLVFLAAHNTR